MSSKKNLDDENSEQDPSSVEKSDEKSDDETSSNASSEYEVEKIIGKRRRRSGYEYYIKWVGYDDSANEWIPESSLNCPERVAEFERDEKKRQKQQHQRRESRRSRNSRKSNSKVRKRRVNIIEDDDDDDDDNDDTNHQNEKIVLKDKEVEEEAPKSVEEEEEEAPKLVEEEEEETEPSTNNYGVEQGFKVQAVLGINRTKGDQLHYLVHYQSPTPIEDNMELIPADVAKKFCEDEIIQFYETRITWNVSMNADQ